MKEETKYERKTIHVFDINLETGEVPVWELHVVQEVPDRPRRTSIVSVDLSRVLAKLKRLDAADR